MNSNTYVMKDSWPGVATFLVGFAIGWWIGGGFDEVIVALLIFALFSMAKITKNLNV